MESGWSKCLGSEVSADARVPVDQESEEPCVSTGDLQSRLGDRGREEQVGLLVFVLM